MIKLSALLLLMYFFFGTIFLPEGDFSTLPDLPKMYSQCKSTEDTDMDISDFIIGHLLEVDGIFGIEEHDSNDKPHQPVQFHHQLTQISFIPHQVKIELSPAENDCKKAGAGISQICLADYIAKFFHPPIA